MGEAARTRVVSEFALDAMLDRTVAAYQRLPDRLIRVRGARIGPLVVGALALVLAGVTSLAVRADESKTPFSMLAASRAVEQPLITQGASLFDNTDARIQYAGQWVVETEGSALGGDLSLTGDSGATAQVDLDGSTITLVLTGAPNRGDVRLVVDGQVFTFDLRRPSVAWRQRLSAQVPPGPHHILIQPDPALPGPIDIDGIEAGTPPVVLQTGQHRPI